VQDWRVPVAAPKPLTLVEALRNYWYPAARSDEVAERPFATKVLGESVVLWRDSAGRANAFYDLCIHRGAPLSLGWVDGDTLVCGYHGWAYAADGSCACIPSLPAGRGIPAKARATAYRCQERYGLVWVCLGEPVADIPTFPPEFDDPSWNWDVFSTEALLQANAARWIENLIDFSHHAWIHEGILGDRRYPQILPYEIQQNADGFEFEIEDGGVALDEDATDPSFKRGRARYQVVYPFNMFLVNYRVGEDSRTFRWWVCNPMSTKETRVFRFAGRNSDYPPVEDAIRGSHLIYEQDRRFVEAQRPEELPLDLREELHLRGPDLAALEYRKGLAALGVDWQ
jgi:vanillate O-demethylase monooxygenase subunit